MSSNGVYIIRHKAYNDDGSSFVNRIVGAEQTRGRAQDFVNRQKTDPWNEWSVEKVKYVK